MPDTAKQTGKPLQSPLVRQFSVFLENKIGSLWTLIRALEQANVHICGLSVVDTADTGVVRMVVDDPERCRQALQKASLPFNESNLVVVELPQGPEKLEQILRELVAAEINIQYTYSLLVRPRDKALLALHCEDCEYARDVLEKAGVSVFAQKDISR